MSTIIRTYTELIKLPTFAERFKYCDMAGQVGAETFGRDRWINQNLYLSDEWKHFRGQIIERDKGCEFALPGFEVMKYGTIHHLNPITADDIYYDRPCVWDPENVVFVGSDTHKLLHYGHGRVPVREPVVRKPNDTCPWR